ncbi:hypothetical protein QA649_37510 [Bradyrhizobium sp. CB1717]|uniref:hypothetical protein n=1 Tax=Bradyrhizobium sp. CB1717 TaxID=3039154 RepID=UPI0024B087E2|nr:hypothetical protein [Bradyrhizobium sp. CB1717]WFU23651.1 hypothetical protein QA649_37510 [Bradyrhizobium sp. CB1717]
MDDGLLPDGADSLLAALAPMVAGTENLLPWRVSISVSSSRSKDREALRFGHLSMGADYHH